MAQYLKKNGKGEYLTDIVDIENARLNNLRHTILGCMLGDFDDLGRYVLSKEITKELVIMPKFIVDTVDNIEICHGELVLDKSITFAVSFEADCATLSLLEKINYGANFKLNSGIYSDVVETVIDRIETSGVVDRNVVYKMWNISEFGGNRLDILSCGEEVLNKYFGIVTRFKYLMESNKILLENEKELEGIEAQYAISVLNSLESYPNFKEAVLNQVRKITVDKAEFIILDNPNYVKTFNEILENAIEENLDLLEEKEKESFIIDKRNALREKNVRIYDTLRIDGLSVEVGAQTGFSEGIENSSNHIIYVVSPAGKDVALSDYYSNNMGVGSEQTRVSVEGFVKEKNDFAKSSGESKNKLIDKLTENKIVNLPKVENKVEQPVNKPVANAETGKAKAPNLVVSATAANKETKAKAKGGGGAKKPSPQKAPAGPTKVDNASTTKKPASNKTRTMYFFYASGRTNGNANQTNTTQTNTNEIELLARKGIGESVSSAVKMQDGASVIHDINAPTM